MSADRGEKFSASRVSGAKPLGSAPATRSRGAPAVAEGRAASGAAADTRPANDLLSARQTLDQLRANLLRQSPNSPPQVLPARRETLEEGNLGGMMGAMLEPPEEEALPVDYPRSGLNLSRDEMNLAEFPLTVLSTRADPKVKTLEFSDELKLKSGELIQRNWIITGADKFGLPTSTDDDVILGLIRLSMETGFRDRKVYFTRYELLKALRWSTEGRNYSRLTKSLDRLSGVRIKATNSFYDNTSKSYQTRNFGIIDAYEINDRKAGPASRNSGKNAKRPELLDALEDFPATSGQAGAEAGRSFFIWSENLFDSFRAGFIKKLDLDLYFNLKSSVSRRLYRYLDKHFYFKSTLERPLLHLAFHKLGLARSYKYVSSIMQQLEPGLEELKQVGFLESYELLGKGESTVIRFKAKQALSAGGQKQLSGQRQTLFPKLAEVQTSAANTEFAVEKSTEQSAAHTLQPSFRDKAQGNNNSGTYQQGTHKPTERRNESDSVAGGVQNDLKDELTEALVSRGINLSQARRLLATKTEQELDSIDRIIQYYDFLVETNDIKVSRSKVGFLYRAVETPFRFSVPASFQKQQDNLLAANTYQAGSAAARNFVGQNLANSRGDKAGNKMGNNSYGKNLNYNSSSNLHSANQAQHHNALSRRRPEHKIFSARSSSPSSSQVAAQQAELSRASEYGNLALKPNSLVSNSSLQAQYKDFIEVQLAEGIKSLGADAVARIYSEVEKKMSCLASVLSKTRFQEAINSCVREELIKTLSLPSIADWANSLRE